MTATGSAAGALRRSALAIAIGLVASAAAVQPPPLRTDRASGCRLMAPRAMPAGATAWIGACAAGLAQGPGVVRVTPARGRAPVLFYGLMRAGRPVRGVIDAGEDWMIGDFRDGERVDVRDDPDAGIKQFRAAVLGAEVAARWFAAKGATASAAFYRAKAVQIDRTSPGGH